MNTTLGSIAVPLSRFMIEGITDGINVRSNETAHIIASADLYLFFGHDDGYFGMTFAHYTHGFRPANASTDYITSCLFFDADMASCPSWGALNCFFIMNYYLIDKIKKDAPAQLYGMHPSNLFNTCLL